MSPSIVPERQKHIYRLFLSKWTLLSIFIEKLGFKHNRDSENEETNWCVVGGAKTTNDTVHVNRQDRKPERE